MYRVCDVRVFTCVCVQSTIIDALSNPLQEPSSSVHCPLLSSPDGLAPFHLAPSNGPPPRLAPPSNRPLVLNRSRNLALQVPLRDISNYRDDQFHVSDKTHVLPPLIAKHPDRSRSRTPNGTGRKNSSSRTPNGSRKQRSSSRTPTGTRKRGRTLRPAAPGNTPRPGSNKKGKRPKSANGTNICFQFRDRKS